MPDSARFSVEDAAPQARSPRSEAGAPAILLKQGIAVLAPVPLAQGAFGQVYLGKMLNPLGLLAERIVWGEENPRWLGLSHLPYEEVTPESPRLPTPILDPVVREEVYRAAQRLWEEYRKRRKEDPTRADEEFKDWLALIDPMLREDRTVAVKVLRPSRATDTGSEASVPAESVRRFIKENDLLRRLAHPGIVRRFGLVRDPALGWCTLLEYIEGVTLEEHLGTYEGRRMPIELAARRIAEVARAVEYAHGRGIVHRDLKPQNIMIRRESSSAVIMDFGIGKWIDETSEERLTMVGMRVGTPRYMAPEQAAQGGLKAGPKTDVYQLATLLFEMVTGEAAYQKLETEQIFGWLGDPARRHPTYVQDLVPTLSQEFEALIEVGREKDPRDRWTITEFRARIEEIIQGGHYEKRRHRKLTSIEDVEQALTVARVRRKEALWKEHAVERELLQAQTRQRIEEARKYLEAGDWKKAKVEVEQLRFRSRTGGQLPEQLAHELETLEKSVRVTVARSEAVALLSQAEVDYEGGRFLEVGSALRPIGEKIVLLPRKSCGDLYERYKQLSRQFEANHRAFVDLFNALREGFVEKIRMDYKRLHDLYGAGKVIDDTRIEAVLKNVASARNNLATIDRDKVGRGAHEAVLRDLKEQEIALRDLLGRSKAKPPK